MERIRRLIYPPRSGASRSSLRHDWSFASIFRNSLRALCFGLVVGSGLFCAASANDLTLQPGDVIDLNIAAPQTVSQRAAIDIDGEISLLSVGTLKAAGMTLAELRDRVKRQLSSRVFYTRSGDGRDRPMTLEDSDVIVTIAQYRPIFVDGDVAKPGEQPFRPGLTVRQAVAMAGGVDLLRSRAKDPFIESSEYRAEYDSVSAEYASALAEKVRVEAELAGKETFDATLLKGATARPELLSKLTDLEQKRLTENKAALENEKKHFQTLRTQLDQRIATLRDQQEQEQQGVKVDRDEADAARALLQKGITSNTRATEARRAVLLSATRLLQTEVQLNDATKQKQEAQRSLEKVDEQHREKLLSELQQLELRLQTLSSRLRGVADKLLYAGALKSQLTDGVDRRPSLVVHRKSDRGEILIQASDAFELVPSDVVEVMLKLGPPLSD